mgnify:CR=1 FL=1
MEFSYKALTESGSTITGNIEAESRDDASEKLLSRGYIPQKIARGGSTSTGSEFWENLQMSLTRVTAQELLLFTKQFRTMFRSGISILEIFDTLENQTENPKLQKIIIEMKEDINQGESLYNAFSKHPEMFSDLYCSMIRAGETSGALSDVMDKLISLLEHENKIKSDIRSALQYPMIVVLALGIAFFVLLTYVIPKFANIFKSMDITLPLPTQIAIYINHFLTNYWYICLAALIAVILSCYYFFRSKEGKYILHHALLRIPIIGPVMQKSAMSRFASIFALLQASGVSVLNSLNILSNTIGNKAISEEFDRIHEKLQEGKGISEPLKYAHFFPPMVINMISIGEESGNLDEMLQEISSHYDEEVAYAVSKMTTNLGPILIVGLAFVVGFFALSIFLPMWDLTQAVQ